jgi:molybdenum cofactor synthesis domain-containing protein
MSYSVAVIIISDRASAGDREDLCLPEFISAFKDTDFNLIDSAVIPDNVDKIESKLRQYISESVDLIFTSGGTGCAPRDITPDATKSLLDKPTPGLDEAIRSFSLQKSPYAMFSRGVSGIAGKSLIVNLPGSPKAVSEILAYILPVIAHPLDLMAGRVKDCQEALREND